jgi:hypothetical protein
MCVASTSLTVVNFIIPQAYSNGLSEVILGKAIKKFNIPRDEIVVMTKVLPSRAHHLLCPIQVLH